MKRMLKKWDTRVPPAHPGLRPYLSWTGAGVALVAIAASLMTMPLAAAPVLAPVPAPEWMCYFSSVTQASESQRSRFAKVHTIRLTVNGEFDQSGEGSKESMGQAMTELLKASGLTVVTDGPADAELIVRASARPFTDSVPVYGPESAKSVGEPGSAGVTLAMQGENSLDADWHRTDAAPMPHPWVAEAVPVWRAAKECARRSFTCLLVQLDAARFKSLLHAQDPAIRGSAFATADLHPLPPSFIPELEAALKDRGEDVGIRASAALALAGAETDQRRVAQGLLAVLTDKADHSHVRSSVAFALANLGPAVKSVYAAALAALKDSDPLVRWVVAIALADVPAPHVRAAIPVLIEALDDDYSFVRAAAACALSNIRPPARAAPVLVRRLRDSDPDVRAMAALALGAMHQDAAPAVSALVGAIDDESPDVRQNAACALYEMGPSALPALPALIEALRSKKGPADTFDTFVMQAFGAMGPKAVPALTQALKAPEARLREGAALGLSWIGAPAAPAVPALAGLLNDENERVRGYAAMALGAIGKRAKATVPALLAAAADESHYVRGCAVGALAKCGPNDPKVVAALVSALKDPDPEAYVRRSAAEALYHCTSGTEMMVPALVEALADENADVRTAAVYALGQHPGSPPGKAVEALVKALDDKVAGVRFGAVASLGKIGPAARAAVPALRRCQKEPALRRAAGEALRKIEAGR